MPATIEPVADERSLPKAPSAGGEELWLIQVPGDVQIEDLQGLRFKLAGNGEGVDMASLKAAGRKYRLVEEHGSTVMGAFVLPPSVKGEEAEFGAPRPLTRRVTLLRKTKGAGEEAGEEAAGEKTPAKESGRTPPGKDKEKKRKREKEEKSARKEKKQKK